MQIEWKGHACFLITTKSGTKILTDPFNDQVGYPVPNIAADYVTVSHQHYDHNAVHILDTSKGRPIVLEGSVVQNFDGVEMRGIPTFHDPENGAKRGQNTVFLIKTEGITLCHLGDLGHLLSDEQVAEIGNIDVLLIPVGGVYTIDAPMAHEIVEKLKPSVVIPMHYNLPPYVKLPLAPVTEFLRFYPEAREQEILRIEKDSLPTDRKVVLLQPRF